MTLSNAISELNILEKTMHAYRHAMGVLSLDSATCAPAASAPARGETMGVLGEASYKLLVNPRTEELLQTLREQSGDVDATLRRRGAGERSRPEAENCNRCVVASGGTIWYYKRTNTGMIFVKQREEAWTFRPERTVARRRCAVCGRRPIRKRTWDFRF